MSKPFLIIQLRPEDETADNEFESITYYGGMEKSEVIRIRAEKSGLPSIDLDRYAAIIVGGSPFNVSDRLEDKSEEQKRVESDFYKLFDRVVERDFPFLGCCSGNGLLGSYCGASISRKYGEPVGGANIVLTKEGKGDPLLEGLPDSFRVLLGHKEACDSVPPGCILLATNNACPVQIFRLKTNIYATQFHPEGDSEGFIIRIHVYKDYGYFPPETVQELIEAVQGEHVPEAQSILRRFVNLYR
ncbi:MAG: glutamine amidotransferase [Pseudomonadota bacterium]|jgi:GMP synthase (glutamine-hydrolysing)|nr:glutamine amidotransferase [Pseudomonadota bacterium]|tara:strand:- start:525 stop:1256 length:732 start_codon:yes stop_codon:yes gene_type:complete